MELGVLEKYPYPITAKPEMVGEQWFITKQY
jgi:hypothetical protein